MGEAVAGLADRQRRLCATFSTFLVVPRARFRDSRKGNFAESRVIGVLPYCFFAHRRDCPAIPYGSVSLFGADGAERQESEEP
jgi:hypothetical protein